MAKQDKENATSMITSWRAEGAHCKALLQIEKNLAREIQKQGLGVKVTMAMVLRRCVELTDEFKELSQQV